LQQEVDRVRDARRFGRPQGDDGVRQTRRKQFRLLDRAFEIPGADGITVAVYALDAASRVTV
jgi:hypothetical protein